MDIERMKILIASIKDDDILKDKEDFEDVVRAWHPNGFSFITEAKKIKTSGKPYTFHYEIQYANAIRVFGTMMRIKYKDPDMAAAVSAKIYGAYFIKYMTDIT